MKLFLGVFLAVLLAAAPETFAFAKKPKPASAASAKQYACPMFCQLSDKPGKCAKCGMEMGEVSFT